MANMAVLNTVYNNFLTTYAPKGSSPFDTHKKSELRGIYNSIVKMNKEAPVYLTDKSNQTTEFAVSIKEQARQLRNTIASLGGLDTEKLLGQKTAYSSNENIASAVYIGSNENGAEEESVSPFELEVLNLATPQTNTGNFLPARSMLLPPGGYSFDVSVNELNYEFQFNINEKDTNKDLQDRLSRLINNANIGIESAVLEDASGNTSLRLQSSKTGVPLGKNLLFTVSDENTSKAAGAVSYLGLSDVTGPPSNAVLLLNGNQRITSSNTFAVDKKFEITLHGTGSSEGRSTQIGLKTDYESLTDNIEQLIGGYNTFLQAVNEHLDKFPRVDRLSREINGITETRKSYFATLGLQKADSGSITVDKELLKQNITGITVGNDASETASAEDILDSLKDFTQSLLRKTAQISLDPMQYVDQKIVAYKNPARLFANPYITSAYSGMMFNSYC